MLKLRRTTAGLGLAALVAAPLTVMTAAPASAAEKEFPYAGAIIKFEVEKDDGRFEVEVDIDDAKPGSKWRVVLWHDGKRYHRGVHTVDATGDADVKRNRPDTAGRDVFKLRVKRLSADRARTRVIRLR